MVMQSLSSYDLLVVAEAWLTNEGARYGYRSLPRARALWAPTGHGAFSYQLPRLEDALGRVGGVTQWTPGDELPPRRKVAGATVTGQLVGHSTEALGFAMVGQGDRGLSNFEFFERDAGPTAAREIAGAIDADLVGVLQNTTIFGTVNEWTGTNAAGLDDPADWINQTPSVDIDNTLRPMRKLQVRGQMGLFLLTDPRNMDVFARHPAYTGAGLPGVNPNAGQPTIPADRDAFLSAFARTHRLDGVIELDALQQVTAAGQTATLDYIAEGSTSGPLFTFALMDVRTPERDIRPGRETFGPDGGLALAYSEPGMPDNGMMVSSPLDPIIAWYEIVGNDRLVRDYLARGTWDILTPRFTASASTDFGAIMRGVATAGAVGIFTTAPT
jgi:hypothetical protein